jgi:small subunit ribosomal protein S9
MKSNVTIASGKRKRAVARATLRAGTGRVRINSKLLELHEPEIARLRIKEPVLLAGEIGNKVNIDINVIGGGWSSQADASRLAVARALVDYTKDKELEKKYLSYDRGLLVADTRYKEQRKPNTHSHARAKRQKSYR